MTALGHALDLDGNSAINSAEAESGFRLRVLSLGAGVQSTALALMAAHREFAEMPDLAIFADTGDEKRATYAHVDWLETVLPYPLVRVRRFDEALSHFTISYYRGERDRKFTPPFHSTAHGMLPIHCSKEWKTRAIIREVRTRLGYLPKQRVKGDDRVEMWLGISLDEFHRQKPAEPPWLSNRWPLIERRLRRGDCLIWLERHGYTAPPRSACTHCPLQTDREFAEMEPIDFAAAVAVDEAIRAGGNGTAGPLYVSWRRRPLAELNFAELSGADQPDLFGNECGGHCGV